MNYHFALCQDLSSQIMCARKCLGVNTYLVGAFAFYRESELNNFTDRTHGTF